MFETVQRWLPFLALAVPIVWVGLKAFWQLELLVEESTTAFSVLNELADSVLRLETKLEMHQH